MNDKEEYLDQLLNGSLEKTKKTVLDEGPNRENRETKLSEDMRDGKQGTVSGHSQDLEQEIAENYNIKDIVKEIGDLDELDNIEDLLPGFGEELAKLDGGDHLDDQFLADVEEELGEPITEFKPLGKDQIDGIEDVTSTVSSDGINRNDEFIAEGNYTSNSETTREIEKPVDESTYGSIKSLPINKEKGLDEILEDLDSNKETLSMVNREENENNIGGIDTDFPTEVPENREEGDDNIQESGNEEDDLMRMLSEMDDEDGEIADIAAMLKAHDNNEDIAMDSVEINKTQESNAIKGQQEKVKKGKEPKKGNHASSSDGNKKKGFWSNFLMKLFGEVEPLEEMGQQEPAEEMDPLSEEEQEILNNLQPDLVEKLLDEAPPIDKKAEKAKAQQEAKEVKAEKKKLKEEKKLNAKKMKRELEAQMEPVAPIPKKPAFLIVVMAISVLILIIFSSNGLGYKRNMADATKLYQNNEYVDSYTVISGTTIKEDDQMFYYKVTMLASLQQDLRNYNQAKILGKKEEELDAIIRGVGKYITYQSKAESYGILDEYRTMYSELERALVEEFYLTDQQAIELYEVGNKTLYSAKIMKIVEGLINPDVKD